MAEQDLPPGIFADPPRSSRNLLALHEAFITSGSQYPVADFSAALNAHLLASPDPDMMLTNLVRFAEISVSKASLFNDLLHYPISMEVLLKLFGASRYFSDVLVRDPGLFRWLTASEAMNRGVTGKSLAAELGRVLEMFASPERRLDAFKRIERREVLRIGAQDLLESADLATVTRRLSVLADTLIDATGRIAVDQLSETYGTTSAPSPFAIIGLGKLGGGELNYSSDVDILFVYGDEGEGRKPSGVPYTYHEYFNKLAERIVQNLSQPSHEGHLYRVDTRLRPESGAGPLARSLRSYLLYYESRGELWERQMLIKARPVGGDPGLGEEFLRQIEPFVYPRTFFQTPLESIARIKARIEAAVGDAANVKLMAGGIRDVEFIVQALQLINGGKLRSVRERNTLLALQALTAADVLSHKEQDTLARAYVFYRTLEHRLQTMLNTQTHTLPSEVRLQEIVARMMGLSSAGEFHAVLSAHLRDVKAIFDRVLALRPASPASGIMAILEGGVEEKSMSETLASRGFRDTRRAMKNLKLLTSGSALTDHRELDVRARDAFRAMGEAFFADIARTRDPDMTLDNFTTIAATQKLPHQLYTELADPRFRKFLIDICAVSPRFAQGLARNPLLMEYLMSDIHSLAEGDLLALPPSGDLIVFKNQQEVRAGVRHILGFSSEEALGGELARLADFVLAEVFADEMRKAGTASLPLALFALGKYGTGEMSFDADLDLIFVSGAVSKEESAVLERAASSMVQRAASVSENGKLYDVDVRLRPEGVNAPLVVTLAAYEKYLRGRASLWERQSLTRLRYVCGNASLAADVISMAEGVVYREALPEDWVDQIVAMRRRMESRSKTMSRTFLDLKLGPGGMADIEFFAQMVQMKAGGADPTVRSKGVLEVLHHPAALAGGDGARERFAAEYRFFREIIKLIRITLIEKTSVLPEGEKLETLARVFDGSDGESLRVRVARTMKEVRAIFLTASANLAASQ